MGEKLGSALAVLFVPVCIAFLGLIIRFSIISSRRRRGVGGAVT